MIGMKASRRVENRERYREGDLQNQQADEDSHGVEQRRRGGATDVATEDVDGLVSDAFGAVVGDSLHRADDELPHLRAVFEEEEQDDRHHSEARADFGDRADSAEGSGSEIRARDETADLLREVIQLTLAR